LQRAVLDSPPNIFEYIPGGPDELQLGARGLRSAMAEWAGRRDGRTYTRDNVILANGSSHALSLVATVFIDPGDVVITEPATFAFMVNYLGHRGARMLTAPFDDDGLDVTALAAICDELRRDGTHPKLVYTIPSFQMPTGKLMPLRSRYRLLELAEEHDFVLVEDNCYYDIWYDEAPPPTLLSLDRGDRVVQSDSFSKMLAPAVRLGFAIGPPEIITAMGGVREDLGVSPIMARATETFVREGLLAEHVEHARSVNRRKRDIADAALREHCAPYVRYRTPGGGIYFWLELAPDVDVDQVRRRALEDGVACRPGQRFSSDDSTKGFLRVAFLHVPEDEIRRGIEVLGRALAASARR
jgi:2-aminoadipate transaminase